MTTLDRVRDILVYRLNVDHEYITLDTKISEEFGVGMVGITFILTDIEVEFDIKIPGYDATLQNFDKVGDMVQYIDKRLS